MTLNTFFVFRKNSVNGTFPPLHGPCGAPYVGEQGLTGLSSGFCLLLGAGTGAGWPGLQAARLAGSHSAEPCESRAIHPRCTPLSVSTNLPHFEEVPEEGKSPRPACGVCELLGRAEKASPGEGNTSVSRQQGKVGAAWGERALGREAIRSSCLEASSALMWEERGQGGVSSCSYNAPQ